MLIKRSHSEDGTMSGPAYAAAALVLAMFAGHVASAQGETFSCPTTTSSYEIVENTGGYLSWFAARDGAEAIGGRLAATETEEENDCIASHASGVDGYWIGGFQDPGAVDFQEPAGGWYWLTGDPIFYTNWGTGQPDDAPVSGGEDCLQFYPSGVFNDRACNAPEDMSRIGYIVEFADTGPCEPGWTHNPASDHCYRLTPSELDWGDAEDQAVAWGGHLVTIDDSAENQWLLETFGHDAHILWIGFYQDLNDPSYSEPAGAWKWISGEPITYTNWDSGEPNNDQGLEHCGDMRGYQPAEPDGSWNDLPCTANPHFGIVEKPAAGEPPEAPDPILYWSFDDPGNVGHDDSGNGHDLTIPGSWTSVPGPHGQAISFEFYRPTGPPNVTGSPYGPYTSTSGLGYPGPDGFTVAHWAKVEPGTSPLVGDYWQHVANGVKFGLKVYPDPDRIYFEIYHAFSPPTTIEVPANPYLGQWIHVAATYDPSGYAIRLYINGEVVAQGNMPAPMRAATPPYLYTCGSWHATNPGTVDEVYLYDQALTDDQIAELASAGGPSCGDGVCEPPENNATCPHDCYCGNGTCESDEASAVCPQDCAAVFGQISFCRRQPEGDPPPVIGDNDWQAGYLPDTVTVRIWCDDPTQTATNGDDVYTWPFVDELISIPVSVPFGAKEVSYYIEDAQLAESLQSGHAYLIGVSVYGIDQKVLRFMAAETAPLGSEVNIRLTLEDVQTSGGKRKLAGVQRLYSYGFEPLLFSSEEQLAIQEAIYTWEETGFVDFDTTDSVWRTPVRFIKWFVDEPNTRPFPFISPGPPPIIRMGYLITFPFDDYPTWRRLRYTRSEDGVRLWESFGGSLVEQMALHELGHALGLRYPQHGPENWDGDSLGEQWSVMSYLGGTLWPGWSDLVAVDRIKNWTVQITGRCPVDIEVTDGAGNTVAKGVNEIPGASYVERDLDGDGDPEDQITIPEATSGLYSIRLIPEPGADPEDTVTLVVKDHGRVSILLDHVPVADLPMEPVEFVVDRTPPVLTLSVSPSELDGCDDSMVTIAANVATTDDQDAAPQVALAGIAASSEADPSDIGGADYGEDDREFQVRATLNEDRSPRVYTIVYVAADATGNVSQASATVTVEDNTPPSLNCPLNTSVECDGEGNTADADGWLGGAIASDDCGGAAMTNDYSGMSDACGATGAATVTWTAEDESGNSASCSATFTIVDTSMPEIACPAYVSLECPADTTPEATGLAAAADACGGVVVASSDASVAGCGGTETITRTWTATDECENAASCDQVITVVDTTPPDISCPGSVITECESADGSAITFAPSALDACDSAPVITCLDQDGFIVVPGDTFPIGYTAVGCSAQDACSNVSLPCDFGVTVESTPPTIASLDGAPLLVPVNSPVEFEATFTDNPADTHIVAWDFGDMTGAGPAPTTSPALASHVYTEPGIYTASVSVTDRCENSVTDSIVVVVYDPAAGFTTGGGWFVPDADSFIDGINLTDAVSKAHFGFVVKYHRGASSPDGNLEFRYKAGDINLQSTNMDWLVVQSATKVRFKGLATINNSEELYTFKVTAEDNGEPGTNDVFKIEIWLGVQDTENGPPTPKHMAQGVLGGGNIAIHTR